MNHLKWMGHVPTIMEIQKTLQSDQSTCDVVISCHGKMVRAHKFILCSCSDFFSDIFKDLPLHQEYTLIIPDIKEHILESILNFIYMGEVALTSANLSDFLEGINILGIKSAIHFECHVPSKGKENKEFTEFEVDEEAVVEKEIDNEEMTDQHSVKEFEYLEVYNEPEKIGYTIETMGSACTGTSSTEYILTESSGTFTLSQQSTSQDQDINTYTPVSKGDVEIISEENPEQDTDTKVDIKAKIKKMKTETEAKSISNFTEPAVKIEALEGAVDAVVEEGMSLQKAANKFNISKTVLWRRVRKHPHYMKSCRENPLIESACEKLKAGESLKSISQSLDIPMSTLHRHKVRLAQEGRLPEYVTFKKRGPVSKEVLKIKLKKAVDACLNGMSQNQAATVYEVPKSTLWRHLQKQQNASKEVIKEEKEDVF